MSAPRYSVIMPVFNKGPHLRRSVSSVLRQSETDTNLKLRLEQALHGWAKNGPDTAEEDHGQVG